MIHPAISHDVSERASLCNASWRFFPYVGFPRVVGSPRTMSSWTALGLWPPLLLGGWPLGCLLDWRVWFPIGIVTRTFAEDGRASYIFLLPGRDWLLLRIRILCILLGNFNTSSSTSQFVLRAIGCKYRENSLTSRIMRLELQVVACMATQHFNCLCNRSALLFSEGVWLSTYGIWRQGNLELAQ